MYGGGEAFQSSLGSKGGSSRMKASVFGAMSAQEAWEPSRRVEGKRAERVGW